MTGFWEDIGWRVFYTHRLRYKDVKMHLAGDEFVLLAYLETALAKALGNRRVGAQFLFRLAGKNCRTMLLVALLR